MGFMFLVNVPVLVGLTATAFRSTRWAFYFALGATGVQLLIVAIMLAWGIGDVPIVLGINCVIIIPMAGVTAWSGVSRREASPSIDTNTSDS